MSLSFRSGPVPGHRITRRVLAMHRIWAIRGAWGIRRTRGTTVTWASRGARAHLGFMPDAGLVPLMEPLPDPQEQFGAPAQGGYGTTSAYGVSPSRYPPLPQEMRPQEMPRHEIAPPVMNAPLPTRVPPVVPGGHRAVWDEALAAAGGRSGVHAGDV